MNTFNVCRTFKIASIDLLIPFIKIFTIFIQKRFRLGIFFVVKCMNEASINKIKNKQNVVMKYLIYLFAAYIFEDISF